MILAITGTPDHKVLALLRPRPTHIIPELPPWPTSTKKPDLMIAFRDGYEEEALQWAKAQKVKVLYVGWV